VESKKERWYTLPKEEFESLHEAADSTLIICKEFIKSQAGEIEVDNWENSTIPFAIKLYSSLQQFLTFLEQKLIEEPPKRIKEAPEWDENSIAVTENEWMTMALLMSAQTICKDNIVEFSNHSFELH
tara:strand:+ start:17677 stop:18057 length:381 start_codon:yes stop_codon:yes gene_type:complete